jgi:hypothetical protein
MCRILAKFGDQVPRWEVRSFITTAEGEVHMVIVTRGIGLAKNVFALHGVDATGNAVRVRPSVVRSNLVQVIAQLPP